SRSHNGRAWTRHGFSSSSRATPSAIGSTGLTSSGSRGRSRTPQNACPRSTSCCGAWAQTTRPRLRPDVPATRYTLAPMRGILAFVAASIACATSSLAQAPQAPAADPAPIPRYEVEVIVFAHRDFDATEESFDQTPNGFDGAPAALREAPVFDETTFAPPAIPQTPPPPPDP